MTSTHFRRAAIAAWLAAGLIVLFIGWAEQAQAQQGCGRYEDFKKALEDKYQERRRFMGVGGGMILEVYVSQKETFTILVVKPNRFTCIVAGGEGWTEIEPEIIGEKKL